MTIVRGFTDLPKEEVKPYQTNDSQSRKIPWTHEVISRMGRTSPHISSNMAWYEEENRKRKSRLENEIDQNEIRMAARGVRNKWLKAVNEKPDLFKSFLVSGKSLDWQSVKDLKDG